MATSDHVVWISCATGMMVGFLRTEDGRPDVNLTMGGAGTGNTFLDVLTDDTAMFGTAVGEQAGLYLSTDRGTHFTRLSAIPETFTNSGHGLDDMAFLTPLVGLAITDSSALSTSRPTVGVRGSWSGSPQDPEPVSVGGSDVGDERGASPGGLHGRPRQQRHTVRSARKL